MTTSPLARYHKWLGEAVAAFVRLHPKAEQQLEGLEDLATQFERSCRVKQNAAYAFVSTLVSQHKPFAPEFIRYVTGSPHRILAAQIGASLSPIRTSDFGGYINLSLSLASHSMAEVAYGVAGTIFFNEKTDSCQQYLPIIEKLAQHVDFSVRAKAVQLAGRAAKCDRSCAEKSAAIISATFLTDLAETWHLSFAIGSDGVPIHAFTKDGMRRVLENFVRVPHLDRADARLDKLLAQVSAIWPELVAELLIERLRHATRPGEDYYCWGGLDLSDLSRLHLPISDCLPRLLTAVRDAAEVEGTSDFSGRELFWALAGLRDKRAGRFACEMGI